MEVLPPMPAGAAPSLQGYLYWRALYAPEQALALQERPGLHADSDRELLYVVERDVAFRSLYRAHESSMQTGFSGQVLLAPPPLVP